ncbi:MAG: signal peptidase II [Clostridia bacterium]|nr:signal peptidase II [Clostridia bacterium]
MNRKEGFRWVWPGLLVLLLDRLVKWLHLTVSENQTVRNSGMAFGMFQGNSLVILIVSVLLLAACFFLLRKSRPSGLAPIALSMIAGGALGNMIDRLLHGYVIDMFPFFGWFVFNVADVGVVAGAILCGWSLLFRPSDWSAKEK